MIGRPCTGDGWESLSVQVSPRGRPHLPLCDGRAAGRQAPDAKFDGECWRQTSLVLQLVVPSSIGRTCPSPGLASRQLKVLMSLADLPVDVLVQILTWADHDTVALAPQVSFMAGPSSACLTSTNYPQSTWAA